VFLPVRAPIYRITTKGAGGEYALAAFKKSFNRRCSGGKKRSSKRQIIEHLIPIPHKYRDIEVIHVAEKL